MPNPKTRQSDSVRLLFQRAAEAASTSGFSASDIEREITDAMFSEAGWLVEQLHRLHDDDCADAWRVWRLQELADYCRRSPMPTQQVKAFADFLELSYSPEVQRTAAECIRLLLPPTPRPPVSRQATVEWLDGESVVARFEHPRLGIVEREFERDALPVGAEPGDSFVLEMELDRNGRVSAYNPQKHRPLVKRQIEEWERIPEPEPPEDLDDVEAVKRYDAAMSDYLRRVLPLRSKNESQGWP